VWFLIQGLLEIRSCLSYCPSSLLFWHFWAHFCSNSVHFESNLSRLNQILSLLVPVLEIGLIFPSPVTFPRVAQVFKLKVLLFDSNTCDFLGKWSYHLETTRHPMHPGPPGVHLGSPGMHPPPNTLIHRPFIHFQLHPNMAISLFHHRHWEGSANPKLPPLNPQTMIKSHETMTMGMSLTVL